ncbi:hypothetical protein ACIBSV_14610 [Embleya sp. NPDC050154]|uniref:hypothetical protein n=1 Tax=Embleya sp. NPDC050154 TaxID=3363988 RepID=UPI0037958FB2
MSESPPTANELPAPAPGSAPTPGAAKADAFVVAMYADPASADETIKAATGLDRARFEADWADYVRAESAGRPPASTAQDSVRTPCRRCPGTSITSANT